MAGGGYRGILAAVPTAQNLHSASRRSVHRKSKTRRPAGRPDSSTLARPDRSHAPRGNAAGDALRPAVDTRLESCAMVTRSVTGCIPTRSVGTINRTSSRASSLPHLTVYTRGFSPLIRSSVSSPSAFDFDLDLPGRPYVRGASAWLLGVGPRRLFQVTRRQGGTNSRRYPRNGYAPNPNATPKLS